MVSEREMELVDSGPWARDYYLQWSSGDRGGDLWGLKLTPRNDDLALA